MQTVTVFPAPEVLGSKKVFKYTFFKNPAVFKWILSFKQFCYDPKTKMLYSEPREELLELLELQSKGKIIIDRRKFQKEAILKAQPISQDSLAKIAIPKHLFPIKCLVKLAVVEDKKVYLLTSSDNNACKTIFAGADFISYIPRLGAFCVPLEEKYLRSLLKISSGRLFISLHQHVKLQSLYLQSCLWRQSYNTKVDVPLEYLQCLKSSNYSINTIQNYYCSFFTFLYYCSEVGLKFEEIRAEDISL